MRSRYSAYALGLASYLASTQQAPFDPARLSSGIKWVGLTVEEATQSEVEFTAHYLLGDRLCSLHERSKFERVDGRWLYTTGAPRHFESKVGRNDPCPCGSSRKFKSCCS